MEKTERRGRGATGRRERVEMEKWRQLLKAYLPKSLLRYSCEPQSGLGQTAMTTTIRNELN